MRYKFLRRRVIAGNSGHQWQVDLIDLSRVSKYNSGYKFVLTCIDVFSRKGYAVPLKSKSPVEVVKAFKTLEKSLPFMIQSDKGTEFKGRVFQSWLKSKHVEFFTSQDPVIKCSLVERFNRTLMSKLWRYFTRNRTLRYLDVLGDIVESYNDTRHKSIGMAPNDVTVKHAPTIWRRLYPAFKKPVYTKALKFQVGDSVRISKAKKLFAKSYLPQWSQEIFTVHECLKTYPPTYKIKDWSSDILEGSFYEPELQKVKQPSDDDIYEIEDILKREKHRVFVKWKGYPSKFNSWVAKKDLVGY